MPAPDPTADPQPSDPTEASPRYPDPATRALGEELLTLHEASRAAPDDPKTRAALAQVRQKLRQGPLLQPGEIVCERFRLLYHLRDGALAATWRGWDLEEDGPVAVKVLHARFLTDAQIVAQFFDAAARMAKLEHVASPKIRLLRGTYEGFELFVTDAHGDQSLADQVKAGLGPWAAVQAVLEAGHALATAHAQDLFHLDLSPQTLYIDASGAAWLTDFALAPRDSQHMGSVYDAPERMEPGAEDRPQSDVYSLAMTLLFALHQQPLPFWVMRGPDRLIQGLDAPEPLKTALSEAIRWEIEERTASVDALLDAITASPELLQRLAEAADQRGRHALAVQHYQTLLAQGATQPELRVHLARALSAQGELTAASEQLHLALQDDQLQDMEAALTELRALSEQTGDWLPLCEVLTRRADDPTHARDALLLEVARIRAEHTDDLEATRAAWEAALQAHTTRAQARAALDGLLEVHAQREDWEAYTDAAQAWLPLASPDERGPMQRRVALTFLERLDDPQRGLLWLERALDSGVADPELLATRIQLRAARGDWAEVVAGMQAQADTQPPEEAAQTLHRAAQITRHTLEDPEASARLYQQLADHPAAEPQARSEALHWLAAHASDDEALAPLAQLPPAPADHPARWVADTWRRARLLHEQGELDAAAEALEQLLAHQPAHVLGLQLQGRLHLRQGALPEATDTFSRLLEVIAGLGLDPLATEAHRALSDLACYRGDLQTSLLHTHEIPFDPIQRGWLEARVAIWAAAQPQAYPAWLQHTPPLFTPQEALARLLAGILTPSAMRAWAATDPLGKAWSEQPALQSNDALLPLASLTVDLLVHHGLIGPSLFERLSDAFPEAVVYIETVRWLWCEGPADDLFPVADSYQWDPDPIRFDPELPREVLHLDPPLRTSPPSHPLIHKKTWAKLVARDPERALPIESAHKATSPRAPLPALDPLPPLEVSVDPPFGPTERLWIDEDPLDLGPEGLGGEHPAQLIRSGPHLYLVGEQVLLNGAPRDEVRLGTGATVQLGERTFSLQGVSAEELPLELDMDDLEMEEADFDFEADDLDGVGQELDLLVIGADEAEEGSYDELIPPSVPADDPQERTPPDGETYDDATEAMAGPRRPEASADQVPTVLAPPPSPLSAELDDLDLADFFDEEDDPTLVLDLSDPVGIDLEGDSDLSMPVPLPGAATDPLGRHAVVIRRGDGFEEVLPFDDDLFIIGRNPADDLFIESPGTGFLYQLHRRGDEYIVEEALVGGTSEERALYHGDTLHVEGETLTFKMVAEPARPPLVNPHPAGPPRPPAPKPKYTPKTPSLADAPTTDPAPARAVASPAPLASFPEPSVAPAEPTDAPTEPPAPKVRNFPLLVEVGEDEAYRKTHPIQRSVFCIGRGRKSDLQLVGDAKISRLHCTLVRSDDGLVKVRDNGSSNGTFVNGRKVKEQILQVGDIIGVGNHEFEFRLGSHDEPPRKADREADSPSESPYATQVFHPDDYDVTFRPDGS